MLDDGRKLPYPDPNLDEIDDSIQCFADIADDGMTLTESGYKVLQRLLIKNQELLDSELLKRIEPIIKINYYDTAVREACLLLETRVRTLTGTALFGNNLVEHYYLRLVQSNMYTGASLKIIRTDLRSIFKFIRNEHAHNISNISFDQCIAILVRVSWLLKVIRRIRI